MLLQNVDFFAFVKIAKSKLSLNLRLNLSLNCKLCIPYNVCDEKNLDRSFFPYITLGASVKHPTVIQVFEKPTVQVCTRGVAYLSGFFLAHLK